MGKHQELSNIIKNNLIVPYGKLSSYPNIDVKMMIKAIKHVDSTLDTNDIVAIVENNSLNTKSIEGLVFMLTGVYNIEFKYSPYMNPAISICTIPRFDIPEKKIVYLNYKDLLSCSISGNEKNEIYNTLNIFLTNGEIVAIKGKFYKNNLQSVFFKLKNKFCEWDDIVCTKLSGYIV